MMMLPERRFPEFVKFGHGGVWKRVGRLFTIVQIIRTELISKSDVANSILGFSRLKSFVGQSRKVAGEILHD